MKKSSIIRWLGYTVVLLLSSCLLTILAFKFWGTELVELGFRQLQVRGGELRLPQDVAWQGRTLELQHFGIKPGLDVESLALTFRLPGDGPLLLHPFDGVTAQGVTITIEQGDDGVWRVPILVPATLVDSMAVDTPSSGEGGHALFSSSFLAALPEITVRDLHLVLAGQDAQLRVNLDSCALVPTGSGWDLSLAGHFLLDGQKGLTGTGSLRLAASLDATGKIFSAVTLTVADVTTTISSRNLFCRLPSFKIRARGVAVDRLGRFNVADLHGELVGGSLRDNGVIAANDLTAVLTLVGFHSPISPFAKQTSAEEKRPELDSGQLRLSGRYTHGSGNRMQASLVIDGEKLSAVARTGKIDLQGEGLLAGPLLHKPLAVSLAGGTEITASSAFSRLAFDLKPENGGSDSALVHILAEAPVSILDLFGTVAESQLPLALTAQLDFPRLDTLLTNAKALPSPLSIKGSLAGSGYLRCLDEQLLAKVDWRGDVVGGPAQGKLALTTKLALGPKAVRLAVSANGKATPLAINFSDLPMGESVVSAAFSLAEDGDQPLMVASWQGGSPSLRVDTLAYLDEPLLVSSLVDSSRRLDLSGEIQLAGVLKEGALWLTGKPDLHLAWQQGQATAIMGISGEVQGVGDVGYGEFAYKLGDGGLELVLAGGAPGMRLSQSARFRLENGVDDDLLRFHAGQPWFSARLTSLGPRFDLAVGDTRFVVLNDGLSLGLKGKWGSSMAAEFAIRKLMIPEQLIISEGIRAAMVFDPVVGLVKKIDLNVDRINDVAKASRFADFNFWAQLREKGERLSGEGSLAVHDPDSQPLALPLRFDLAGNGRSGRVVLAANDLSLEPGSINLKNLFPVVVGSVNSAVANCGVRSEISWDADKDSNVLLDTRLSVSDFDIDLAMPDKADGKLRLIGGDIIAFLKAPLHDLAAGRLMAHIDAVTLISPQFALFGVQGLDLLFEPLWPVHTPKPLTVTFDELSGFLPFNNGKLSFAVEDGRKIAIQGMEMHLAGGMVSALPLTFDPGNPKGELRLAVQGVKLSELREKLQISLKDDLEVSGELAGVLPIDFSPGGIRLRGAMLEAKKPGLLRYRPGDPMDWRYNTGKSTLQVALSDFHYDSFRLELSGDLGEAVTVDLHSEGTNPELAGGLPIDLNFKIHAELEKLLSAYNSSVGGNQRSYAIVE